ncbi:MAG: hypothetical protein ACOX4H_01505 [Bacillota bacterium]
MMLKLMNNKGSVLILVVFGMLIAFFLGTVLLEVSTIEFAMANNQVDGIKAYYIAEAGVNKAIASFMHNAELLQSLPDILKNVGDTMTLEIGEAFGGGSFSDVDVKLIERTEKFIIIELVASGTFNNAKRELVTQGQLNFDYNVNSQFMDSKTAVICVEQFTTSSGFIYVDGNVFSFGGIECGWNSTIKGDTFGYDAVSVVQGTVDGDLYGTRDVSLGWGANVGGDVTGRGTITIAGGNDVGGDVFGSGEVTLDWDADVAGSVKSLNKLNLNGGNDIGGEVFSSKDMILSEQCKIAGNAISLGMLTMTGAVTIGGDCFSEGNMKLNQQCKVAGNVVTRGNLTLTGAVTVSGDCFSAGNINSDWNKTINGKLVSYGTFTDGGGSKYNSGIWGRSVVMKSSGTTVIGPDSKPIKYIDSFQTESWLPFNNLAQKFLKALCRIFRIFRIILMM